MRERDTERENDRGAERAVEWVAQSGSCVRCGRALGLASAKVDGRWYGNTACARDGACPLDARPSPLPEAALSSSPRRFFGKRAPKELRRTPGDGGR